MWHFWRPRESFLRYGWDFWLPHLAIYTQNQKLGHLSHFFKKFPLNPHFIQIPSISYQDQKRSLSDFMIGEAPPPQHHQEVLIKPKKSRHTPYFWGFLLFWPITQNPNFVTFTIANAHLITNFLTPKIKPPTYVNHFMLFCSIIKNTTTPTPPPKYSLTLLRELYIYLEFYKGSGFGCGCKCGVFLEGYRELEFEVGFLLIL